jgi:hypothetical protein
VRWLRQPKATKLLEHASDTNFPIWTTVRLSEPPAVSASASATANLQVQYEGRYGCCSRWSMIKQTAGTGV